MSGGPELHASAGATVVGARTFLIAYNINLETEEVSVARHIAKKIRASSGGFPNVKALGLYLLSRKQSQVSMNLTDFRITPVHVVFDAVREQAEAEGVRVAGSEIIGLIPKAALEMAADHYLRCENFSPDARTGKSACGGCCRIPSTTSWINSPILSGRRVAEARRLWRELWRLLWASLRRG